MFQIQDYQDLIRNSHLGHELSTVQRHIKFHEAEESEAFQMSSNFL